VIEEHSKREGGLVERETR